MNIKELKEAEPVPVAEVSYHWYCYEESEEVVQIKTGIVTDGEIEDIGERQEEQISEYFIGKKKYNYPVDTLKTENLYLKNHNYVVTYQSAREFRKTGSSIGWYCILKDISAYILDKYIKEVLKEVKKIIKGL